MKEGKTALQLAAEHWNWLEPILFILLDPVKDAKTFSLLKYLYITAMVHGYRHRQEEEKYGNKKISG